MTIARSDPLPALAPHMPSAPGWDQLVPATKIESVPPCRRRAHTVTSQRPHPARNQQRSLAHQACDGSPRRAAPQDFAEYHRGAALGAPVTLDFSSVRPVVTPLSEAGGDDANLTLTMRYLASCWVGAIEVTITLSDLCRHPSLTRSPDRVGAAMTPITSRPLRSGHSRALEKVRSGDRSRAAGAPSTRRSGTFFGAGTAAIMGRVWYSLRGDDGPRLVPSDRFLSATCRCN